MNCTLYTAAVNEICKSMRKCYFGRNFLHTTIPRLIWNFFSRVSEACYEKASVALVISILTLFPRFFNNYHHSYYDIDSIWDLRLKYCSYIARKLIFSYDVTHWGREQNGRHFAFDILKPIFFNEISCIFIQMSLKYVHKGSIDNMPSLVQIMVWRRTGDKPLSEPMMV